MTTLPPAATPAPGGVTGALVPPPGLRGWERDRLAALSAAGHPPRVLRALLAQFEDEGSYRAAWAANRTRLAEQGLPDPNCPDIDLADGWVLVAGDEGYPAHLLDAPAAPLLLFGTGNRQALLRPGVAVVGTRTMTALGEAVAASAVTAAASVGAPVVSGMARGVDQHAHTLALDAGLTTVAVVATGPDRCPSDASALAERIVGDGGAVVSEHPFRTGTDNAPRYQPAPYRARLMARNRIIAALSSVVVPCEGTTQSGTVGTLWAALGMDRPVIVAVPRPSARYLPNAQLAAAFASSVALDEATLRRVGASASVAKRWAGRAPLASCAAHDRTELEQAVAFLHQMSRLVTPDADAQTAGSQVSAPAA